jgi:hypothetical protein
MIGTQHRYDVILGDQAQGLLLADLGIALMIGLVQLDLCAAEIGQPGGRAEGQCFEFGMGRVDDFSAQVDGVLCRLPRARRP